MEAVATISNSKPLPKKDRPQPTTLRVGELVSIATKSKHIDRWLGTIVDVGATAVRISLLGTSSVGL
jgi:hypothetical protein